MSVHTACPVTTRKTLGQVLVCLGCCCGRTDKGHPPVPVDWLKSEWKRRMLPKKIHLSISGCLGPCDASNVVLILYGQEAIFLGGLHEETHYLALADWATDCDHQGCLVPLPESLEPFRLERFVDEPVAAGAA
ncbi:MAG: (2Fe-2S) ferredoxin domain-containing protein [Acidobacteria bacterium]|nr:(2Fe-2S) ferredoxin domain-containing protein [Acidobacteriota bacterium]